MEVKGASLIQLDMKNLISPIHSPVGNKPPKSEPNNPTDRYADNKSPEQTDTGD